MASFYFDEDVSSRLARLLRTAGHDVLTADDLGLRSATDDVQFVTSVQRGRLLVTHNRRDFTLLHDVWRGWPATFGFVLPPHPGILVLDQTTPEALSTAVLRLLIEAGAETPKDELFWWRATGVWLKRIRGRAWVQLP